ncbi:MAG: DNA translocase FtsK 4TM domain-containing protein [Holophagales bacterium]|nr:DNA translocase FtsK 4TM domain-containing protein [Holophagales bacterium]
MSSGYGRMVGRGLLLLLASLTLLSLASYHPNDPNLLSKGSVGGSYSNLCGFIGANLAGLPVALVGLGAWLLPVYIGWDALSHEYARWRRRVAWLVFAMSSWTFLGAFGTINWPPGGASAGQIQCGGWIGYALWPGLKKILGSVGLPITLTVLMILSLIVIAPTLARAFGKLLARWFENRAWPWLKPIPSIWFQAFIGMVKRPFLTLKQHGPEVVPELDVADGRLLQTLNDHQQAVDALEKAERETAEFRRKNQPPKETEFPPIYSEKLPFPIQPIVLEPATPGSQFPNVLTVAPGPKVAREPIPSSPLLKDLPPPPKPKQPLVEPRVTKDSAGRPIEQLPLGLSEPTPNQPLPEIPELRGQPGHPPGSPAARSRPDTTPPHTSPADRFDLPPRLLFDPPQVWERADTRILENTRALIQQKLTEFKVKGSVTGMQPGPVVTVYEFAPDPGVHLSKVMSMEEDLALGLKAEKVRIDRILGKNVVGIEVPNARREVISFREILDSPEFREPSRKDAQSLLTLALGKDLGGAPIVADLAKMPHLLIGGSTGSGKSVGVNAMICSILLRARSHEVKLILVDPKMVELGVYEGIPHLWAPVVTDMREAGRILKWVVAQMEERYRRLTLLAVRNLEQFNDKVFEAGGVIDISDRTPNPKWPDRPQQLEPLPYVVVIIDELADLMMVCRSEVEESIARIAQKARAVGIHLILATQRPSVDIVTGVIKANLPARLSYRVNTKIDSRTILDSGGGEQLLGKGDALFLSPGTGRPKRIHAPLIKEDEILRLVEWLKERGRPDYNQALIQAMESEEDSNNPQTTGEEGGGGEDIYDRAVAVVMRERKASTSLLQRRLNIGYGRAARIIDRMEEEGLVGPDRGAGKPREVFGDAGDD